MAVDLRVNGRPVSVDVPNGTRLLSPCTTVIASAATPSWSAHT